MLSEILLLLAGASAAGAVALALAANRRDALARRADSAGDGEASGPVPDTANDLPGNDRSASTAGAEPISGPVFGSLGSITDLFLPEAGAPIVGSLVGNLGSIANMSGSATESLDSGSILDMRGTLVDGSS